MRVLKSLWRLTASFNRYLLQTQEMSVSYQSFLASPELQILQKSSQMSWLQVLLTCSFILLTLSKITVRCNFSTRINLHLHLIVIKMRPTWQLTSHRTKLIHRKEHIWTKARFSLFRTHILRANTKIICINCSAAWTVDCKSLYPTLRSHLQLGWSLEVKRLMPHQDGGRSHNYYISLQILRTTFDAKF